MVGDGKGCGHLRHHQWMQLSTSARPLQLKIDSSVYFAYGRMRLKEVHRLHMARTCNPADLKPEVLVRVRTSARETENEGFLSRVTMEAVTGLKRDPTVTIVKYFES